MCSCTAQHLDTTIHPVPPCLATDAALKQQALIALGCGAAEALGCPAAQRWEALAALERQLLMLLPQGAEGADALVAMLLDATVTVARHKVSGGMLMAQDNAGCSMSVKHIGQLT